MEQEQNDIIIYTVKDVKSILKISSTQAYALVNSKGFPSYKINRKIFVTKDNLLKWINSNTGKTFLI